MTAALWRLIRRVAADLGPETADALLRIARAWSADPANRDARDRLIALLIDVSRRTGGMTPALAASAARVLTQYRRGVARWERELMSARYAIPQLPSGEARAAALETYLALTEAAPEIIGQARNPDTARRTVATALMLDARMLRGEALGPRERTLALETNQRIRALCADERAGEA